MKTDSVSFNLYLNQQAERIERALEDVLPKESERPCLIHEVMRYAVLGGGKRIRPTLTLSVAEMFGKESADILLAACAVELVHCYSLVHDDLPALDNDEFRRGKLTCHKKFGEAVALLAGDALLTLAFQVVGKIKSAPQSQQVVSELALAAGTYGMIGGQVVDVCRPKDELDYPTLDYISIHKTGQLIRSSCLIGAIMAEASEDQKLHVTKYGEYLGFAFQMVDDILDGDGYLRLISAHEAKTKASELITKAKEEIMGFKRNERLLQMADLVLNREK